MRILGGVCGGAHWRARLCDLETYFTRRLQLVHHHHHDNVLFVFTSSCLLVLVVRCCPNVSLQPLELYANLISCNGNNNYYYYNYNWAHAGSQRNELSVSKMLGARATFQCHITLRQSTCLWLHRLIVCIHFVFICSCDNPLGIKSTEGLKNYNYNNNYYYCGCFCVCKCSLEPWHLMFIVFRQ